MEKKNFATYEYMTKTVKASQQTKTADTLESFGWEATDTVPTPMAGSVSLSFRRDRKISHKNELNRLERKAAALQKTIDGLNAAKKRNADIFAYSFGSFSALLFGGGMCLTMLTDGSAGAFAGGVIMGLAGIALCGLNVLFHKKIVEKKVRELTPVIEENEEKLAVVCEQAHSLLDGAEI